MHILHNLMDLAQDKSTINYFWVAHISQSAHDSMFRKILKETYKFSEHPIRNVCTKPEIQQMYAYPPRLLTACITCIASK